ncbi:peptidylprolyl isomerase [uncultured Erythrobacter sp.]|uniref:peptidylprolyl isomerase n=1 Tax=uncultured Erythrobacter sp. TaxID=263913 RepID=UPI00262D276F|nr:peptidylprolyl isomerase [uncultured Erythrobacter sp.]
MISLFRNFFQSKIGLPIFIGFLVLVGFAFAMADVSGSATFGGLTGDDKIVVVGNDDVSAVEMTSSMNSALRQAQAQNPTITMQQFIDSGALEDQLELIIDRYSIGMFAQDYGLRAGENLVNSELLQISAFQDLTGNFDRATYLAALQRQGITDEILRRDISDGMLAQQILSPAFAAPVMPEAVARQYAALVLERRRGSIGLIPGSEFAPDADPAEEELNTFYSENRSDYVLPERRTLRVATFGADSVTADLEPTAEQIAERYEANAELYDAGERRAVTSFVVPTQEAANALVARIRGGISLEAAAQEAGFNVSPGPLLERDELTSSTSAALADAVFAASEGSVADPARAALGWYVARVDDVEAIPARSLAEVRDDIAGALRREAQMEALAELSSRIEEMVNTGTSLTDVATGLGLEMTSFPDVTANGQVFGSPGQGIPPGLRPILDTAFQMSEGNPQLAELVPGVQFLIFDVADIVESDAPPIELIRDRVVRDWKQNEGNKAAREAADRILAAVRGGTALPEAMRAENAALGRIENVDLRRVDLLANAEQGIPTALVLMFSMAQNSTKILEDSANLGWYVVDLDAIETDPIEDNPDTLTQTREQLTPALVGEYNAQLTRAIRDEVGVERNEEAIEQLRATLTGAR